MKVLILRFSSIGDIVLTTPVIRCLKEQLKDVEVHYFTKKAYKMVLEHNPYIDHLHLLNDNLDDVIGILKNEDFDYVVDLHKNLRTGQVKRKLKVKSLTFSKLNFEKYLMVNFKINKLPDLHIVDRYFEAVAPIGVKNDGKGLDYFISKKDEKSGQLLAKSIGDKYIAVVLGGKFHTKKYPLEKLVAILSAYQGKAVLLGAADEAMEGLVISKKCGSHVTNLCGKISLNESAFLIRQAEMVVTNDTGLMHIAAAYKKNVISIWGNTIPAFGMYPYFGNDQELYNKNSHIIEVKDLKCRPCSKLGYKKGCPKKHFRCMNDIDEQKIIELLSDFNSK